MVKFGRNYRQTVGMTKRVVTSKAHIKAVTRSTGTTFNIGTDTGFTADGDFIEGVLHHIGMKFHRE